jgi:hypothetical protein
MHVISDALEAIEKNAFLVSVGVRRCPSVPVGARRCPSVPVGARRCPSVPVLPLEDFSSQNVLIRPYWRSSG